MKPDFLFVGPDKTGSTWMYEILRRHPECYVPEVKDIYFFDRHYDRGMEWYLSFFADAPASARAVGELCHDYLFSEAAPRRIARDLPGVKILTCLRDPAERSFSHYLYMIRSGRTQLPFRRALDRYPELLENSRYHRHLSRYYDRMPAERIHVLWFRRLKEDARAFARDLFRCLGLTFVEDLPYDQRFLPASRPRFPLLALLMKKGADLARRLGLTRLVGRVKRHPAASALYEPYGEEKPTLTLAGRRRVVEELRDDVRRLEALLDVELDGWLETQPEEET